MCSCVLFWYILDEAESSVLLKILSLTFVHVYRFMGDNFEKCWLWE